MSSALPSLSLLPGERPEFTFCEPVWVTGPSPWCIRKPSPVGPKFGGGVDTPSLCGRVPVGQGWDLEVRITKHHLGPDTLRLLYPGYCMPSSDPIALRVARRFVQGTKKATYTPDPTAPDQGEWDRSGDEPRWRQAHRNLVTEALREWKGFPSAMRLLMADERQGAPLPGSGSGKQLRAKAAALLWELEHKSKASRYPLYRGSHEKPDGEEPWSTSEKVAKIWAAKNHGQIFTLPAGTKGLRIADYLGSDVEREWIVSS